MPRLRYSCFSLGLAALLVAPASGAQSVSPTPPVPVQMRPLSLGLSAPSEASPLAQFAAARGLGAVGDLPGRAPVPRVLQRLTEAADTERSASTRRSYPMPVATVDPSGLEPMPVAVGGSTATAPSARIGTLVGCDNPLRR